MTPCLFTQKKDRPAITEKTLAALISRASTRVNVDYQDYNGILGIYLPNEDRIFLFKAGDISISPECVAMEEAGHSLQRDSYIEHRYQLGRLKERLLQYHPHATAVLDWLEDARVFRALKKDYPGASADLDSVWKQRGKSLKNLGFDIRGVRSTSEELMRAVHRLVNKMIEIVGRYLVTKKEAKNPLPLKFEGVLDEVEAWLLEQKELQLQQTTDTPLLVSGLEGDQRGKIDGDKLTMIRNVDADLRGVIEVSISIVAPSLVFRGFDYLNVEYPWPVLSQDVLDPGEYR